jgi:two-component system sensor histidine kinase UhpB
MPKKTNKSRMSDTTSKANRSKKIRLDKLSEKILRLEKAEKELKVRNKKLHAEINSLKKDKKILEKDHDRLRSLLEYLQDSEEQERMAVVHKVYDELGSILTALKMDINLISEELCNRVTEIMSFRDASNRQIDTAIHEVRRLGDELRPPILDQLGLAAAIHWQASQFEKQTGISCQAKIDPGDLKVDRNASIGLFRILRGLLDNVIRHARAESVQISLEKDNKILVLTVKDDGIGITDKQLSNPKSLGLISMHERAQSLKGRMTIDGEKNKGTRILVKIPYEESTGLE